LRTLLTILFLTAITIAYCQTEVEIYFSDACDSSIKKIEYELFNPLSKKSYLSANSKLTLTEIGTYLLSTGIVNGDFNGTFSTTIEIDTSKHIIDTLFVPPIRFTTKTALHSQYWSYFNCMELCDGTETDFYPNKNKRLEGEFSAGKPFFITTYRSDGSIKTKTHYAFGTLDYEKVEYYNQRNELEEYAVYKNRKKRTIKKLYDATGNFLEKEIEKHYIEE